VSLNRHDLPPRLATSRSTYGGCLSREEHSSMPVCCRTERKHLRSSPSFFISFPSFSCLSHHPHPQYQFEWLQAVPSRLYPRPLVPLLHCRCPFYLHLPLRRPHLVHRAPRSRWAFLSPPPLRFGPSRSIACRPRELCLFDISDICQSQDGRFSR